MANNNDNSGAAMAIAFVGAGMLIAGALIFALLAFASFVLTVVCFTAWNKPIQFCGETLTPEDARGFVRRGLIGACLVPSFAFFASGLFGVPIRADWVIYLPIGGYALGSVVVTYHLEKAKAEAAQSEAAMQALLPQQPARQTHTIEPLPSGYAEHQRQTEREPFRFATWDDEEELRK
jgi:hypothetical protein